MKNLQEYYADQSLKSRYEDYRAYVFDCVEQLTEYMGAENLLENLTLCMKTDNLANKLDCIIRAFDLDALVGED